ncbi:MAG: diaminopimelate epimerase [Phycisphaerales bacterium]|nr:diaminopimelate epimerase [Phycisphaerales bacterium]
MTRSFSKMHGLGNSYIFVSTFESVLISPETLAVAVSDRNRGIGSDGLIVIGPGDDSSHVSMHIYNADGSAAEMCGNGIRCACKYVYERDLCRANPMVFSTPAGLRRVWYEANEQGLIHEAQVEMGIPKFGIDAIALDQRYVDLDADGLVCLLNPVTGKPSPEIPPLHLVSMGNPHAIIFVDALDLIDMSTLGPCIEKHPAFPERINVHAVEISRELAQRSSPLKMLTWERGSGLTQACGTGAAAVCAAVVDAGYASGHMEILLPGGMLALNWPGGDTEVSLRGDAVEVCSGTLCEIAEPGDACAVMPTTHFVSDRLPHS